MIPHEKKTTTHTWNQCSVTFQSLHSGQHCCNGNRKFRLHGHPMGRLEEDDKLTGIRPLFVVSYMSRYGPNVAPFGAVIWRVSSLLFGGKSQESATSNSEDPEFRRYVNLFFSPSVTVSAIGAARISSDGSSQRLMGHHRHRGICYRHTTIYSSNK